MEISLSLSLHIYTERYALKLGYFPMFMHHAIYVIQMFSFSALVPSIGLCRIPGEWREPVWAQKATVVSLLKSLRCVCVCVCVCDSLGIRFSWKTCVFSVFCPSGIRFECKNLCVFCVSCLFHESGDSGQCPWPACSSPGLYPDCKNLCVSCLLDPQEQMWLKKPVCFLSCGSSGTDLAVKTCVFSAFAVFFTNLATTGPLNLWTLEKDRKRRKHTGFYSQI